MLRNVSAACWLTCQPDGVDAERLLGKRQIEIRDVRADQAAARKSSERRDTNEDKS